MSERTPQEEEWDAELWAALVNACLPGESVLDMLRRTSTPVVNIEDAVR